MKLLQISLVLILVTFPLIGCAPGASTAAISLLQAAPTPSPTPTVRRWDISLSNGREWSVENGWKTVRIEIVVVSKTNDWVPVSIGTKDALLFTDAEHSYPAETLKTTGSKLPVKTDVIDFKTILPGGYRMKGEYLEDMVAAFCFQATIPQVAQPKSIRISGYPDISIKPYSGGFLATAPSALLNPSGRQIDFGSKVKLTVGSFERNSAWPSTHDLISAKISLTNVISTDNTTVKLFYAPITDEGIVGTSYTDTPDCKPKLIVGPATAIESRICALVPHGKTQVHMIFWGDGQAVYDTQLSTK